MATFYKLFRLRKDGTIGPLFINRKQVVPIGKWVKAKAHRTPGFKFNPGWHATLQPMAPHLSERGRVWMEVECRDFKFFSKPEHQGGTWVLANHLRVVGPANAAAN